MLAHCDKCDTPFDSHEGGTVVKGVTYCPRCEQLYDPEDVSGLTADQTAALDEAAWQDEVMDAYEQGMDSTGMQSDRT